MNIWSAQKINEMDKILDLKARKLGFHSWYKIKAILYTNNTIKHWQAKCLLCDYKTEPKNLVWVSNQLLEHRIEHLEKYGLMVYI